MNKFVHLRSRSHYTFQDGISTPSQLVKKAKELGYEIFTLTDLGQMYGLFEFYNSAKQNEIKPILGCEVYVAKESRFRKDPLEDRHQYQLLLLAKSWDGYLSLCRLTSLASIEGFYYKPRIDMEILEQYSKDLVVITGGMRSELVQNLYWNNNKQKAKEHLDKLKSIFGKDDVYIEIQKYNFVEGNKEISNVVLELAKETNTKIIATSDIRYTDLEKREAHDVMLAIQAQTLAHDSNRLSMINEDLSLKPESEMLEIFGDLPDAIANTLEIAEKCNLQMPDFQAILPTYKSEDGKPPREKFLYEVFKGFEARYNIKVSEERWQKILLNTDPSAWQEIDKSLIYDGEISEYIKEKLDRILWELKTICNAGYDSYFLIVWDFINWARSQGIAVGPGRGSAAGAVVAYCLYITNLDPIEHGLLFERFLNPDRVSMPDIDIDFADDRRGEVIKYIEDKYGHENVAHIGTFGTLAARAAFKDVARAFGKEFSEVNKISQMIEVKQGKSSLKASVQAEDIKEICSKDQEYQKIFDTALQIEGCARQAGTHACAMVVSDLPLNDRGVPIARLTKGGDGIQTQYEMGAIEAMGMLKVDFLGLRNLSVVTNALKYIKQRHNKDIDIDNLKIDDPETYKIFAGGHTVAVFQFESNGMRKYLKDLKPSEFEHIVAMAALYRPGPMEAGFVEMFINRKNGKEKVVYDHEDIADILGATFGVTVYQEQVMQISRRLAGFTGGQADVLRKAIGKKKIDVLAKMELDFIEGCKKNGYKEDLAKKIWNDWQGFASYAFNKSHSACYAFIAYQTAWLKAHYPIEFCASLLNADRDNSDRLIKDIQEVRRLGIEILPPSINESGAEFTIVDENKIRFGLEAIKGVGSIAVQEIITARG